MKLYLKHIFGFLCCFIFLFLSAQGYSQTPVYSEYEIKAGMIQRFIKYMTPSPKKANEQIIRIGILGEDPFGSVLESVCKGRNINGKKVEIFRAKEGNIRNLESCHVIVVCRSEKDRLREIISHAHKFYIITIGDNLEGFCQSGGIVNFTEKTVFELNLEAAKKIEATIDPQMVRLLTPDRIISTSPNVKD